MTTPFPCPGLDSPAGSRSHRERRRHPPAPVPDASVDDFPLL